MVCVKEVKPRKVISAAIIYDKRILVVKKRHSWILPGGKPERNESALECLSREINEELPGTVLDKESIQHYRTFRGISPHKGDLIENDVYFAKIKGNKLGYPGKEISEARWIKNLETYNLSDVTSKVINSLITKGYVNYEILKS